MPLATLRACALALLATSPLAAQTSYPMITSTLPVAVQRGKTTEVQVSGQQNFAGVYRVLFHGAGLKAEGLPEATDKLATTPALTSVKFKITAAADAPLGVREFRLASPLGLSSVGQFVVVDDPVIEEKADNNTLEKAPKVPLSCVVSGRVEALEDVDYYVFEAQAGQTITFEVLGARLEDKIHDLQKHLDPMLTLFDADGRELAANDDFYFADPLLTYTIKKSATHFIQVRDSKYDGDPRWVYALQMTANPHATHVFPMAANPGQVLHVEPVGSARLLAEKVAFKAPASPGLHTVSLDVGGKKTAPTALVVSKLPQVIEKGGADTPKNAQRLDVPCGVSGRIAVPRELDHYIFKGTKGQTLRLEVQARRFGTPLQSSLDAVIDVMTPDGKPVGSPSSSDDVNGKDPALSFTPPADGDYVVRVRDLNSKGAATAVYYLEIEPARQDFTIRCDPDKAMIGPGSSAPIFVQVNRLHGFVGPVKVEVRGLPKGVTASPLTVNEAMTQGVIVLTAALDSTLDAAPIEVIGHAMLKGEDGKDIKAERLAVCQQEIYSPGGGRARFDIDLPAVAVTRASDILKVEATPARITLKPGQEVKIDVTIVPRQDYTKGVSLDIPLRHLGGIFANPLPPGVTIVEAKSKTLLDKGTTGHITLAAAPNAVPVTDVPICVMAHVSINFVVKVSYASAPILVTVEK